MYAGKFVCVDVCIYHACMYVCMYVSILHYKYLLIHIYTLYMFGIKCNAVYTSIILCHNFM